MLSFKQLSTPTSVERAAQMAIDYLSGLGFSATSWQSGSIQLTMVMLYAYLYSGLTYMINAVLLSGYNDTADGEFLDRFSWSRFNNKRDQAIAAQHRVVFTCAASAGPYTPTEGTLVVSDGTRTYRQKATADYTLQSIPSGGSVAMLVEAEVAGAAGNAAVGTITKMVKTYAGVTCSNPVVPGTTQSTVREGADEETTPHLRAKNASKWGALSIEVTSLGVVKLAFDVLPSNSKVYVEATNPRGAGTVDVYAAGQYSELGDDDVATLQLALDKRFLGNDLNTVDGGKRALAKQSLAFEFTTGGTIYYSPDYKEVDIKSAVEQALLEFVKAAPLGGYSYSPGPSNVIALGDYMQTVEDVPGVKSFAPTATSSINVSAHAIVTPPANWAFTYIKTEQS